MNAPFGIGQQKPHHYREMVRVVWENRDELGFAWRILSQGVCDGCALGTTGMADWTLPGAHLCMVRLELLRLNTAPALDVSRLKKVSSLERLDSRQLRELGRLPVPLLRRRGEAGFTPLSWSQALARLAEELQRVDPHRAAFYLTSRGITNEVYYAAQKAARFLGSPHIDQAARLCHAASTVAMKAALGYGASTCSYVDWLQADLIVLFGSNVANNQPVTTKYLATARDNGARIAVVNPYREPGLATYWVPSMPRSAMFGTTIADDWFEVNIGGDRAFLVGVLRALVEMGGVDEAFVREHTTGFEQARELARSADWRDLERESGAAEAQMRAFAKLLVDRPNAIFVWSMGLTQHAHGVETVAALLNVGLARGLVGREGRGLVPIRGHSGVQGGAEVGCVPAVDAATAARWTELWRFNVSTTPGWTATEMVDRAADGDLDFWWIVGGNFLETLAGPERTREALRRPRLRVHHDIMLSSSMLAESDGDILILPATTRYESPGGGTETSTERRIIYSPEIRGRRIGEARPEWWAFGEAMALAFPERASLIRFADAQSIRREIAAAVPLYQGIETLEKKGDQVQWGGRLLFADGRFATADGRAHFAPITSQPRDTAGQALASADNRFAVATRRGKQFNSMVQREIDPLTGAGRDEVFMSAGDIAALGLHNGQAICLRSPYGKMTGRVRRAAIKPGNLEVHWPEGNVLLSAELRDPASLEPDYNALVTVEPVRTE